jgi:hypothetical protein
MSGTTSSCSLRHVGRWESEGRTEDRMGGGVSFHAPHFVTNPSVDVSNCMSKPRAVTIIFYTKLLRRGARRESEAAADGGIPADANGFCKLRYYRSILRDSPRSTLTAKYASREKPYTRCALKCINPSCLQLAGAPSTSAPPAFSNYHACCSAS